MQLDGDAAWPPRNAAAVARRAGDVDAARDWLEALTAKYDLADKRGADKGWKDWVNEGFNSGASRAHAASRLPSK